MFYMTDYENADNQVSTVVVFFKKNPRFCVICYKVKELCTIQYISVKVCISTKGKNASIMIISMNINENVLLFQKKDMGTSTCT